MCACLSEQPSFPLLSSLHLHYKTKISSFKPWILLIIMQLKMESSFPRMMHFNSLQSPFNTIFGYFITVFLCTFIPLFLTLISIQCETIASIINVSCTHESFTHERFHTYCPGSPWRQSRTSNAYSCATMRRVERVPKRWHQSGLNLQIRRSNVKKINK